MKRSTDLERLTICDQPTTEESAFLEKSLHEYDEEQTHGRIDAPGLEFELAMKDPEGNVAGGISVSSQLGVMFLEVLWIADEHRKRGLGRRLVLAAECIAEKGGCIAAGTWTFSWQGSHFYPKCGYKLVGIYSGYPFGVTEHILMKRLPDPDPYGESMRQRTKQVHARREPERRRDARHLQSVSRVLRRKRRRRDALPRHQSPVGSQRS